MRELWCNLLTDVLCSEKVYGVWVAFPSAIGGVYRTALHWVALSCSTYHKAHLDNILLIH